MKDFSFKMMQSAEFGQGSLTKLTGILSQEKAVQVLLVSDRGLEKAGLVPRVEEEIKKGGFPCTTFLDIAPNPGADEVHACAHVYRESRANVTVALGGGSAIDVAKAMRIVAKYDGNIMSYEGAGTVPGPLDPLIIIPTTAGTGSEFTNGAVISDHEKDYKTVIADPRLAARHVILDPDLVKSVPPSVAAACGADAFIHAMEAYLSRVSSPYTDGLAEKAMELIGGNLRQYVACREDTEAASAMLVGSALAGAALALGRLGLIHALSHPISAHFGASHGAANAVLVPAVLEYNALADRGKYRRIYEYLTGDRREEGFTPLMLVEAWKKLNRELGLPGCLEEMGVTEDKFPRMTADALLSPYIVTNPRTAGEKEILGLFQRAMTP